MVFLDLNICTNPDVLRVIYFCKELFKIAMIIIPIFVVIKVILNFSKAVCDSQIKVSDTLKNSFKKILIVIIIFLIPWAVNLFMNIINENTSYESCLANANMDAIDKFQKLEDIKALEEKKKKDEEKEQQLGGGSNNSSGVKVPQNQLSSIKISNISSTGSIVNIKVNNNGKKILGYYFNYKNILPNKENSGYLQTSLNELEVVRLPGKSYIWVEDENHKLSQTEVIEIDASAITFKKGKKLEGVTLSKALENKGSSLSEFDKLIFRSTRAAKLQTKEAAATAAVALIDGLYQKYNIRLPYRAGGKFFNYGGLSSWGKKISDNLYYSFDCDGFSHWAFTNAGLDIHTGVQASARGKYDQNYWYWDKEKLTKDNAVAGDVITQTKPNAHVMVTVGKTNDAYIIAHANGTYNGVWISEIPFDKISDYDYKLVKGDRITSFYPKNPKAYPSGF